MKITKRQLRRIIREEKARLMKEAPAGQYDRRIYEMFKEAIKEVVYEVAVEQGMTDPDGMNIDAEAVQAASAALADAAREFYKEQGIQYDMPRVKIGGEMKITKRQLRRIIKEELEFVTQEPGRDFDYGSGEGKMTRSQLHHVAEYAAILHDMIRDEDDLPEWVQSKVSVMAHNIGKIKHYLEYKILRIRDM